ncbi:MAG: hypothetical protein CMK09_10625 [Ponticaulis sp.]|nr:hypothetical protein [Ponticaulis sp.]|tara:strand:- start:1265 stop:2539 length:1275 start_codon:yes stop_codon:yes gene_type:complete
MEDLWIAFQGFMAEIEKTWLYPGIIVAIVGVGIKIGHYLGKRNDRNWRELLKTRELLQGAEKAQTLSIKKIDELKAELANANKDLRKYYALKDSLLGRDTDLWTLHLPEPYTGYDTDVLSSDLEVMTVMNLKGGVGKSTLATNLAAYFEKDLNRKVLLVDLDFQGSATTAMLNLSGLDSLEINGASALFKGDPVEKVHHLDVLLRLHGDQLPNTRLIPCGYGFTSHENKLMVAWMLRETDEDPRYLLSRFLHTCKTKHGMDFDTVIIDAPPRLSLGSINALTASTSLIIPTIPDRMSTEAVRNFVQSINTLLPVLNHSLQKTFFVMNRTNQSVLSGSEEAIKTQLHEFARDFKGIARVMKTNIPRRAAFSKATFERTLAWHLNDNVQSGEIRSILRDFGDEIADELGMQIPKRESLAATEVSEG